MTVTMRKKWSAFQRPTFYKLVEFDLARGVAVDFSNHRLNLLHSYLHQDSSSSSSMGSAMQAFAIAIAVLDMRPTQTIAVHSFGTRPHSQKVHELLYFLHVQAATLVLVHEVKDLTELRELALAQVLQIMDGMPVRGKVHVHVCDLLACAYEACACLARPNISQGSEQPP